jgi:hypothetical protein
MPESTITVPDALIPEPVGYIVTCADHACRHADVFATHQAARYWAEWGHACSNDHRIVLARHHVAEFPKASNADSFAEFLSRDPGASRAFEIEHRPGRRTVTWIGPATREYVADLAENVGYHGSPPQGPVAILNGRRTPRSY